MCLAIVCLVHIQNLQFAPCGWRKSSCIVLVPGHIVSKPTQKIISQSGSRIKQDRTRRIQLMFFHRGQRASTHAIGLWPNLHDPKLEVRICGPASTLVPRCAPKPHHLLKSAGIQLILSVVTFPLHKQKEHSFTRSLCVVSSATNTRKTHTPGTYTSQQTTLDEQPTLGSGFHCSNTHIPHDTFNGGVHEGANLAIPLLRRNAHATCNCPRTRTRLPIS